MERYDWLAALSLMMREQQFRVSVSAVGRSATLCCGVFFVCSRAVFDFSGSSLVVPRRAFPIVLTAHEELGSARPVVLEHRCMYVLRCGYRFQDFT